MNLNQSLALAKSPRRTYITPHQQIQPPVYLGVRISPIHASVYSRFYFYVIVSDVLIKLGHYARVFHSPNISGWFATYLRIWPQALNVRIFICAYVRTYVQASLLALQ